VPSVTEDRKHTRLVIELPVKLSRENRGSVDGMTRNISFGGVYVVLGERVDTCSGDACQLRLVLQGEPEPIEIQLKCKVVHASGTGLGLKFLGIDASDYQDFQFLMINNSDDPEKLLEELSHNPGLEVC